MGACRSDRKKNELFDGNRIISYNIVNKVLKSICKIIIKKKKGITYGFGFFMYVTESEKYLITNYEIICEDIINETIELEIYNNIKMNLTLKERDIQYFPKKKDITIIQIKKEDEIYNNVEFLYYDMNYINGYNIYKDVYIYSIGHPGGENASYERGKIINIQDYEFNFNIPIDKCSSGCPIILLGNNINLIQVIGIHKEAETNDLTNLSCGTFIGEIFKDNNESINNYIIAEIIIKDDELDKNIRIINSYEEYKRKKNMEEDIKEEKMNEEEVKECKIEINNESIPFKYFNRFPKAGKYNIKYSFNFFLTKINYLFSKCFHLTNIDLSNFNTQNVINMSGMFHDCHALKKIDASSFDTYNVEKMHHMFSGCKSLKDIDISNFNTQNVTNMSHMFENCKSLINIDLSSFDTQNVTNMNFMFYGCKSLVNLDLSNFDTKNVINMSHMFGECRSLINLDLSKFKIQNATDMGWMFLYCTSLKNLNLPDFNTHKAVNMESMFLFCESLTSLNLSNNKNLKDNKIMKIFQKCKETEKNKNSKLVKIEKNS